MGSNRSLWVDVEIELDDIDTDDLICELEGRYLNDRQRAEIFSVAMDSDARAKFLFEQLNKYSLTELQQMFCEPATLASENQLKLSL